MVLGTPTNTPRTIRPSPLTTHHPSILQCNEAGIPDLQTWSTHTEDGPMLERALIIAFVLFMELHISGWSCSQCREGARYHSCPTPLRLGINYAPQEISQEVESRYALAVPVRSALTWAGARDLTMCARVQAADGAKSGRSSATRFIRVAATVLNMVSRATSSIPAYETPTRRKPPPPVTPLVLPPTHRARLRRRRPRYQRIRLFP